MEKGPKAFSEEDRDTFCSSLEQIFQDLAGKNQENGEVHD